METRIFVDTAFVIALVNCRAQHHAEAMLLADVFENHPLLVTDAVLIEIGNALARSFKSEAVAILDHFLSSEEVEIVRLTPDLLDEAFAMYRDRLDQTWGLTDCISSAVMKRAGITEALTFDRHFTQAGFTALMRPAKGG